MRCTAHAIRDCAICAGPPPVSTKAAPGALALMSGGVTYQLHPACSLLPTPTPEDVERLAADIEVHGQREAIVTTHDGLIVDGRTRLLACDLCRYKPVFRALPERTTDAWIIALVASRHLARRHYTTGQLAMVAEGLAALANPQRVPGGAARHLLSLRAAAEMVGIPEQTAKLARRIRNADGALADEVAAGTKSLAAAHREARAQRGHKPREPVDVALAVPHDSVEFVDEIIRVGGIVRTAGDRARAFWAVVDAAKTLKARWSAAPLPIGGLTHRNAPR